MFDVYSKPRVTWSRVTLTERVELCLKDQICAAIFGPLMFLGCGCAHRMFFSSSFDGVSATGTGLPGTYGFDQVHVRTSAGKC